MMNKYFTIQIGRKIENSKDTQTIVIAKIDGVAVYITDACARVYSCLTLEELNTEIKKIIKNNEYIVAINSYYENVTFGINEVDFNNTKREC
ncbi:MAG: hypothetical protein RBQ97_04205 [Acholeplasma sp.]|jgi:hypothetical protein|nr:hypothetical protein [Acholeplasma sp.]